MLELLHMTEENVNGHHSAQAVIVQHSRMKELLTKTKCVNFYRFELHNFFAPGTNASQYLHIQKPAY